MVRCLCGTDNLEKKFCTSCGKQLIYVCEKCKCSVVVMEKFCGSCGTKNPNYDASTKPSV